MKSTRLTPLIAFLIVPVFLIEGALGAPAQPLASPPPLDTGVVTLTSALRRGMDYSQELKTALSQVKGAEDDTAKARGALFPTINGVASAINQQNSTTLTTGSVGGFTSSNGDTYAVGLTLSQPLYVSGAITAGLDFFKAGEDLARQNYFNVKQAVVYNVLFAFYTLAQAQELLDAAESNRDILKSYVDITNHYEQIGRSRKIDQLQAQVNYSLALSDVETDINQLKVTIGNLARYLGDTTDHMYKPDFKPQITPIGNLTLDQAFEAGLKNNPLIRAAQVTLEQIQYTEDIDVSQDLPSLYLTATEGYRSPDTGSLWYPSSNYYSVGLNLTVPLFSGLSSISKRSGYEEKKYQSARALQIAKDNLWNTLDTSLHTLRSAQIQLNMVQVSVKQSREALVQANRMYRQGTASNIDVLNMQTTRYNAEKLFVNSEYSYLQALLILRQQMGIDLEKVYAH